jgi:hypothetical protein
VGGGHPPPNADLDQIPMPSELAARRAD